MKKLGDSIEEIRRLNISENSKVLVEVYVEGHQTVQEGCGTLIDSEQLLEIPERFHLACTSNLQEYVTCFISIALFLEARMLYLQTQG